MTLFYLMLEESRASRSRPFILSHTNRELSSFCVPLRLLRHYKESKLAQLKIKEDEYGRRLVRPLSLSLSLYLFIFALPFLPLSLFIPFRFPACFSEWGLVVSAYIHAGLY